MKIEIVKLFNAETHEDFLLVKESLTSLLVDEDLIHYTGKKWVFFESNKQQIEDIMKQANFYTFLKSPLYLIWKIQED